MKYLKYFPNIAALGTGVKVELPNVSYLEGANTLFMPGENGTATVNVDGNGQIYGIENSALPNTNGYEYIDLGLPSGTLWATCNIGASNEYSPGYQFPWGDIVGYQIGNKTFTWENYKYNSNGGTSNTNVQLSKYNTTDNLMQLELADDSCHANMGGDWVMPSSTDAQELINNTDHIWYTNYDNTGIKCCGLKSKINNNILIIPVYSSSYNTQTASNDRYCYLWLSTKPSHRIMGDALNLQQTSAEVSSLTRFYGVCVRGVIHV